MNSNPTKNTTKIAIFFGSTTCYTEIVAEKIQAQLMTHFEQQKELQLIDVQLFNIKETPLSEIEKYDILLFGISTWDFGEIQEDWLFQWEELSTLNLNNKTVSLFGLGDQLGYGEWFLDAMGLLFHTLQNNSITWCGFWPTTGYEFSSHLPLTTEGDHFVGLALDEDSQYELTESRIALWCEQLLSEWQALSVV